MDDRDTSHDALVFAMPFIRATGISNLDRAIRFALMCWNIALLPAVQRQVTVAELMKLFEKADSLFPDSQQGHQDLLAWANKLIERKTVKYGARNRYIATYTVSRNGDTITLTTGTVGLEFPRWQLN